MEKEKATIPYFVYEGAEAKSERVIRRLIVALIITLLFCFSTNVMWLKHWASYDTVSYDQNGEGINNLNTGNQGNLSNEPTTKDKETKK